MWCLEFGEEALGKILKSQGGTDFRASPRRGSTPASRCRAATRTIRTIPSTISPCPGITQPYFGGAAFLGSSAGLT